MVHPWGFVNSRWYPNGLPFWFCEFAVGPHLFTLGDFRIRGGTLIVHPWGFVNSRWDPNGATFGFCEFAVNRNGAPLGFCKFAVGH